MSSGQNIEACEANIETTRTQELEGKKKYALVPVKDMRHPPWNFSQTLSLLNLGFASFTYLQVSSPKKLVCVHLVGPIGLRRKIEALISKGGGVEDERMRTVLESLTCSKSTF